MPVRAGFLLLVMPLAVPALGYAAPENSAAKAAGTPAATPASEFATLNSKFKTLVAQLSQLRRRYQADPNADKKAIEAQWQEKIEQVRALETKLASSAEKAYLAAPDKSTEESEFLFAYLASLVQADRYDDAARLVTVLAEHGFQHKFFNLLAGLSYFATMDFDSAAKYFTMAKDAGELDQIGQRYLEQIDRHNYRELWAKELAIRAAEDKAANLPRVKLATTKGDIVVALLENEAPIATANFVSLVEKQFFDGLKFHRVIPGFMAQGGDPKGDGTGGPGYTIPDECYEEDHRNHFRGTLSMANSGQRDTGGSQFFLTFLPAAHLDGKHTVFGRVIEGMDVLAKLQRCQPGDANTPDRINKATVLYKRNHRYEPVKRPDKK
jgi:cyclophilin family peptidyl-prolyl cis-trans isomerase